MWHWLNLTIVKTVSAQGSVELDPKKAIGEIDSPTPNTALESVPRIGGEGGNPLFAFVSWGLTFITIACGVWVLINVLTAGASLVMNSGDSAATEKVRKSITNSILGLAIIVLAYAITAIVSTIIFGDPTYYLNPQVQRYR